MCSGTVFGFELDDTIERGTIHLYNLHRRATHGLGRKSQRDGDITTLITLAGERSKEQMQQIEHRRYAQRMWEICKECGFVAPQDPRVPASVSFMW